jgi:hypothetical protein
MEYESCEVSDFEIVHRLDGTGRPERHLVEEAILNIAHTKGLPIRHDTIGYKLDKENYEYEFFYVPERSCYTLKWKKLYEK